MAPVLKRHLKCSFARLSTLAKGRIIGFREEGVARAEVADRVRKTDGTPPSIKAVDDIYNRFLEDPEWEDEPSRAGGRPRDLTPKQETMVKRTLLRDVGKFKVTAKYIKRRHPELRAALDKTIQRTFRRLGYSYQCRRKKAAIGEKYKPGRLKYCDWLLKQDQAFLNRFAYTDGKTFWLARTEVELADKERAAVGPCCWRLEDGSDALEDRNVGPSSYAKSQGRPVKVWGLFFNGRLEYWVLPENDKQGTENMTGKRYNYMVTTFFAKWKRACYPTFPKAEKVPLVKDFEKFLRWGKKKPCDNLKGERDAGFETVKLHPKCSPDFNAIEGWWHQLQQRLDLTAPAELEPRAAFIKRLRRTVTWMNANLKQQGRLLCTNQKARARAVKKLKGARCKW